VLGFDTDASLFAIFDGHGGYEVARFCARHVHEQLTRSPAYTRGDMETALTDAYVATDALLATEEGSRELHDIHAAQQAQSGASASPGSQFLHIHADTIGCTAVTAFIRAGRLYVANAGDSRCILSRAGHAIEVCSPDVLTRSSVH
jgi:serine/threonine protein phosphatase PrpC